MKGIYKAGFKYISNIFVVKERELEIGYPTDVKHVAHIGWEGSSGTAPTWMSEFRKGPEFATTTIGNNGSSLSPWSSKEFGESKGNQKPAGLCKKDTTSSEVHNMPKPKQKRKKTRSTSSPKSGSTSSSSRSSRAPKSKPKFADQGNAKSINIQPKSINIEVA